MNIINVEIEGVAPLLHNRFPIEDHGENATKAKKKIYVAKEQAEKLCYRDGDGKLYQPSEHILGALIKAATAFKFEGRKTYKDIIQSGILITPEQILLNKKEYEIDARRVVIARAAVIRWRPRFDEWKIKFKIQIIDSENISKNVLKEILDRAGQMHGIGDYRPRFGRFQVTKWD